MASNHETEHANDSSDRSSGTIIVTGIVALVVAVTGLWFYSAIWSAEKANPETVKKVAEQAEERCIVQGGGYDRCKRLVGKHHADCRESSLVTSDDGSETLDRDAYLKCMETLFSEEGIGQ